jgi:hypothetical protein
MHTIPPCQRKAVAALPFAVLGIVRSAAAEPNLARPDTVPDWGAVYSQSVVYGLSGCSLGDPGRCSLGIDARNVQRASSPMLGAIFQQTSEARILPRLSVSAAAFSGTLLRDPSFPLGFAASARLSLVEDGPANVSASLGGLRDPASVGTFWGRMDVAVNIGRLRLTGIVQAQHVVASGTDALDVAMLAGASYELTNSVRIGAECLAQDLEGIEGNDAEGGSSERCGPSLSFDTSDRKLAVVLGTSSGIGYAVNATSARAAVSYAF